MKKLDRRQFLKNSAASLAFARPGVNAQAETKKLFDSGQSLSFDGNNYRWEWSAQNDRFRVLDLQARIIGLRSAAGFTKKGLTFMLELLQDNCVESSVRRMLQLAKSPQP